MKGSLTDRPFLGVILPDPDPDDQGKYRVHIPEITPHLAEDRGCWVRNRVHAYRVTASNADKYHNGNRAIYGEYKPLHPGTKVIIIFPRNDLNSGYVDRIISDEVIESLPFRIKDRDDYYQIFRTPRRLNLFAINEDTQDGPPNSVHLYFNEYRTTFVIDEEGIHLYTQDNEDEWIQGDVDHHIEGNRKRTVDIDEEVLVKGNKKKTVKSNQDEVIEGTHKLTVRADGNIYVQGNCNIQAQGSCNIKSASSVNVDAPNINLNCGTSLPASPASSTSGSEVPEYKEDWDERSEKSDDSTTRRIPIYEEYDHFK